MNICREKELAKVTIKKEDLELIVSSNAKISIWAEFTLLNWGGLLQQELAILVAF